MKVKSLICSILTICSGMSYVFSEEILEITPRNWAPCEEYKRMYVYDIYSGSSSIGHDYPLAVSFKREDGTTTGLIPVYRGNALAEYKNIFSMAVTARALNLPIMMSCTRSALDTLTITH